MENEEASAREGSAHLTPIIRAPFWMSSPLRRMARAACQASWNVMVAQLADGLGEVSTETMGPMSERCSMT